MGIKKKKTDPEEMQIEPESVQVPIRIMTLPIGCHSIDLIILSKIFYSSLEESGCVRAQNTLI